MMNENRDNIQLKKRNVKGIARRVVAFILAFAMVVSVTTTPAYAFSLGGFFKKVTNAVTSTVNSIKKCIDTSSSKTVYSYSELNKFTYNIFAPKNIKVKLGSDIYVPSNNNISSCLHNVTIDMNGKTIYCDNPRQVFYISYGLNWTVSNGNIVQRVNNTYGMVYMASGDAKFSDVTFRKSGSASRVTGLYANGILGNPKIIYNNVTFDGMTTGLNIMYGAHVIMDNSNIKNSQGDAVTISQKYSRNSQLKMNGGSIKYFKGNGINAGNNSIVDLENVIITGGTTRNRYGILAGKGSDVNLKGTSKVYSNAGGNIGVYKGKPVDIDSIDKSNNKYSFTVIDGLNGTEPSTVANLNTAFGGESIREYPISSDISRYMVRSNEKQIQIQNPPEQCKAFVEVKWLGESEGKKKLDEDKDANYATVSINGGTEEKEGNITVKYDTKVTLSTTNNNPERYEFVGWKKYVKESSEQWKDKGKVSEQSTYQVDVLDENVRYVAEYQYRQYTITVQANGKGTVTGGGTYYVDDEANLTATPAASTTINEKTTTYGFKRWNDGYTNQSRKVVVSKNETYTAMFNKTGQTEGTLYLGLEEVKSSAVPDGKLLLVYVGKGFENNQMETGAGANIGVTGLPDGSAKMRKATSSEISGQPYETTAGEYSGTGANYYGAGINTTVSESTCVKWTQKATDFDNCNPGYIKKATVKGSDCWLYWCCNGGVRAAGPYVLYKYDTEIKFSMNSVKIKMNPDFKPGTGENTITSSQIIAVATASGTNKEYVLGGLKFGGESVGLDNKINYKEGDKNIALELDGITCDFDFPEAIIGDKQYTKLSDAIKAAKDDSGNQTIEIVGPGVDSIDVLHPVALGEGDKIKGYDSETVTAAKESSIGIDKNGTVRLTKGELDVQPPTGKDTSVGVKDAFVKTKDKIKVTTEDGEKNSVITPVEGGTTLNISPDNNPDHIVTIEGAGGAGKTYQFDNIPSYAGENVTINKGTEYTINVPKGDSDETKTSIKTSKYNTGVTKITGNKSDGTVKISSSKEGDKVTVGDNTYVTGKTGAGEKTVYRVNPNQNDENKPSVILEEGQLGIPVNTTIEVNGKKIKNTGSQDKDGNKVGNNPVQISADGTIDIPDGAGVTIDGVQIEVPHNTPMNGNTTVTLDSNGKPSIKTTGNSEVKIKANGTETTYKVGDYDCVLSVGEDGIPVIEDGEICLKPGQVIKDRLGNEYKCPENGPKDGITIMTTPQVYETDDDGNQILGEDGKPILVGGGDMSFVIPENQSIQCKPNGSGDYLTFKNSGNREGFFNLDPEKADKGIESDSELGLAAGKELNLSIGEKSITVKAPGEGNSGQIQVDGSTGSITLTKAGDKVEIDGKIYIAKKNNTVFTVDENGVTLSEGEGVSTKGVPLNAQGLAITENSSNDSMKVSVQNSSEEGGQDVAIKTTGKTEFAIAPIGNDSAKINFVTGEGEGNYPLGIDGSITLPSGKSITRKSDTSSVDIKASDDEDIVMKPLAKPSKDETTGEDAATTPISGLLLEVPTCKEITIGGKKYKETTVDNGRTGDEAFKLPMQLVLDDKGKVVLYNGSAELDNNVEISLYSVDNTLAKFKNTSKGDQKVQVTNPGIVTMPESGASVTMGTGSNKVEFTTTSDNTQIGYSSEMCMLKRGGVKLNPKEKILVGDMLVRNNSTKDIEVSLTEVLDSEGSFSYTGNVKVPKGGSFELLSPGADKGIVYENNGTGEDALSFTINSDGNLEFSDGGIANLTDTSGKKTAVQAGGNGVESIPTPEGAMFAIPKGGYIVVNDKKYTNSGDEHLVLSVNQDGKVVLVKGDVTLSEGAIVYVKNEEEGLVPIKNSAQKQEGEEEHTLKVSYSGVNETKDQDGKVTSTTFPNVTIQVPTGGEVTVGDNKYSAVEPDTSAKISMDIKKKSDGAVSDGKIPGDRIVLTEGTIDLGIGSTIVVEKNNGSSSEKNVLTNIGSSKEGTVRVGSNSKVELSKGAALSVKNTNTNSTTTVALPKDSGDAYKAAIDLTNTEDFLKVELKPTEGTVASGKDKVVIINDDTYTSVEEDKNLMLTVNTDKKVSLSGGSKKVGLSDGASIVIGGTTVTATSKTRITVSEETDGSANVPKVDVPAGGEANIKNSKKDINVKVPQRTSEAGDSSDNQTFSIDKDGNVSTNLKKDEKVVIGGIEYTGTSETANTVKVDGTTGAIINQTSSGALNVKIDAKQFNKPGYEYKLTEGMSISVDDVEYKATKGSSITLVGNPDGNPIVKMGNAGETIVIGGTTCTSAKAGTLFTADKSGKIILKDNGKEDAKSNSSLKLGGKEPLTVNGVKFTGNKDSDKYTVTYRKDGPCVSVEDGAKIRMDIPSYGKIFVDDKLAVDTKDDKGKPIVETVSGKVIPITMNGGSGSIYLDKTKENSIDTAYLQVLGMKDVEIQHEAEGDKQIKAIDIKHINFVSPIESDKKTEEYKAPVKNENTVEIKTEIKEGTAEIEEISSENLDKIMDSSNESKIDSIIIDLSEAKQEVKGVTLSKKTVETLAKVTAKEDNHVESVTVDLSKASVVLDTKTLETLHEEAKGNEITLVVEDKEHNKLNDNQKDTVKDYHVATTFEAYFESAGTKIHDFRGGTVTLSIKFTPESGKDVNYYHVVYLEDKGGIERYKTKYKDGYLIFNTTHFSDYAAIYDDGEKNDTDDEKTVVVTGIDAKANKTSLTKKGDTATIKVTVKPADATNKKVKFISSNSKVATVDKVGKVTAVANGTTTITVKTEDGEFTKKIKFTVKIPSSKPTKSQIEANSILLNSNVTVKWTKENYLKLTWGKVTGATGYDIYVRKCDGKTLWNKAAYTAKKGNILTVNLKKLGGKKFSTTSDYKYGVRAYKYVNGKKVYIGKSLAYHFVGSKNKKETNAKSVTASKKTITLGVKKKTKLTAKVSKVNKQYELLEHDTQVRYISSNPSVAKVDLCTGKVTGVKAGKCKIYCIALNGVKATVSVIVK